MHRLTPILVLLAACGTSEPEVNAPSMANPASGIPQADDIRFALLASHAEQDQWYAVPVACVTYSGAVLDNGGCAPKLTGEPASLSAGQAILGAMSTVTCEANGRSALAVAAPIGDDPGSEAAWGYLGSGLPDGWHIATRSELPDSDWQVARDTLGGTAWPLQATATNVTMAERMDLNGLRIIEAISPSDDPATPSRSAVFLAGSDIVPLPTDGLDLKGTVTTPGAMPVPGLGYVLVLTSHFAGGSGLHAIHLSEDGPKPLGDWVCGS